MKRIVVFLIIATLAASLILNFYQYKNNLEFKRAEGQKHLYCTGNELGIFTRFNKELSNIDNWTQGDFKYWIGAFQTIVYSKSSPAIPARNTTYDIIANLLDKRSQSPNLDTDTKNDTEKYLNKLSESLVNAYQELLAKYKDGEDYLIFYKISNNQEILNQSGDILKKALEER